MNYQFPRIANIADFEFNLTDPTTFRRVEKDGYVSFNYNGLNPDNFPPVKTGADTFIREARGIAFCSETGEIVARPFHKFFNLWEREEATFPDDVDYDAYEKLDGSMIFPLYLRKGTRLATKAGITDTSMIAERLIAADMKYWQFIDWCRTVGVTPIFELCSRENRIVIDYPEPKLSLLAIRDLFLGEYVQDVRPFGWRWGIPTANVLFKSKDLSTGAMIARVRNMVDREGIVVVFPDGHRLKVKADLYVRLHKYVDIMRSTRLFVDAYYSEGWDDIYANAEASLRSKIDVAAGKLSSAVASYVGDLHRKLVFLPCYRPLVPLGEPTREMRKEFALALNGSSEFTSLQKKLAFKAFDYQSDVDKVAVLANETRTALRNAAKKVATWETAHREVLKNAELVYEDVQEDRLPEAA